MRFSIVAHRAGETNIGLITRRWRHFEPLLLTPREALTTLAAGDAALGRLDIRQGLDGIEDGLWALSELAAAARAGRGSGLVSRLGETPEASLAMPIGGRAGFAGAAVQPTGLVDRGYEPSV